MAGDRAGRRRDLWAAACGALLVAAAVVVGRAIEQSDGSLHLGWPPLYAWWSPHVGPGTPAALAVAIAVIAYGPPLAARVPWRVLVPAAWATAMAWTWSLALIDGWHRGIARRLTTKYEYLQVIDRFDDIGAALRDFTHHILLGSPDHWPPHIAGHPPAATLTFVVLDRIGLGGGGWAGVWCITVGSSAVAAVLVGARALADERLARRATPFLVLAPGAVWVGASADGYFAGVAGWAVALLAVTRARRRTPTAPTAAFTLASGLLFGLTGYLSYGLTLFAVIAAGVVVVGHWGRGGGDRGGGGFGKRWFVLLVPLLAGTAVVPLAFTLVGFNWWEAYHLLVERYYQGAGGIRPYWYFIWANPACTVLVVGLATVAGLGRVLGSVPAAVRRLRNGQPTAADRLAALTVAALLTVAVADLSGMSKAETERIWLPFALWLLPATALLPLRDHRVWLAAQAVLALLINHLLHTGW
nr:hypothetical protein [Streptomyces jeddahensis]